MLHSTEKRGREEKTRTLIKRGDKRKIF